MNANVLGGLTPRKRPRGRAVAALLPGVFALLFAGVSGVAASSTPAATPTASPTPTPIPHVAASGRAARWDHQHPLTVHQRRLPR